MEKEFIPYEQALALKELGFNEDCFTYWETINDLGRFCDTGGYTNEKEYTYLCSAPLYSQAFRWFREKHNVYCNIRVGTRRWKFEQWGDSYSTYEEAELACLKKLIEIVKS